MGKAGAEGKIIKVDTKNHTLEIKTKENKRQLIDLKTHGQDIQLYSQEPKSFSVGDKVLFLKNDRGMGLKNGQSGVIEKIHNDGSLNIKIDNKTELKLNPKTQYNYLSHAYAISTYKSQGQTTKNVIYHGDTGKEINYNQAYVGITRGKESVYIFTNNKKSLFEKVQLEQIKTTTLDYNVKEIRNTKESLTGVVQQAEKNKIEVPQSQGINVGGDNKSVVIKSSYTKEFSYWDANVVSEHLANNVELVLSHIMSNKHTTHF